mmetsp:Transcript_41384/g.119806  ORF Transcript_41384/g.119806 Transcript_41384/m.119806 type:complete len:507 (-) Transcript_41384:39-1559(-)
MRHGPNRAAAERRPVQGHHTRCVPGRLDGPGLLRQHAVRRQEPAQLGQKVRRQGCPRQAGRLGPRGVADGIDDQVKLAAATRDPIVRLGHNELDATLAQHLSQSREVLMYEPVHGLIGIHDDHPLDLGVLQGQRSHVARASPEHEDPPRPGAEHVHRGQSGGLICQERVVGQVPAHVCDDEAAVAFRHGRVAMAECRAIHVVVGLIVDERVAEWPLRHRGLKVPGAERDGDAGRNFDGNLDHPQDRWRRREDRLVHLGGVVDRPHALLLPQLPIDLHGLDRHGAAQGKGVFRHIVGDGHSHRVGRMECPLVDVQQPAQICHCGSVVGVRDVLNKHAARRQQASDGLEELGGPMALQGLVSEVDDREIELRRVGLALFVDPLEGVDMERDEAGVREALGHDREIPLGQLGDVRVDVQQRHMLDAAPLQHASRDAAVAATKHQDPFRRAAGGSKDIESGEGHGLVIVAFETLGELPRTVQMKLQAPVLRTSSPPHLRVLECRIHPVHQ